jgi:PTS system cellobiose-specific IIC component
MIGVIEQSITPLAGKLGQQKYVIAIRDGFTAALPFMIIGSFMLVFIFPPFSPETQWGFARAWLDFSAKYQPQLLLPFQLSMGLMTLFISVGIGASLARQNNLDPVTTGLLCLMSFLLVAAPLKDGAISMQYLSGQGIFTALLTAIYAAEVYAWLKRNNITIKLPPQVPTGVARSFEVLIPVLVIILTLHPLNLLIESATGMILPEAIMSLVKPLVAASDSLPAMLLAVLLCQVLWFAGIHGALIVTGIMNPFWMANLAANQAACGLALTIFGIGLSAFIGQHYVSYSLPGLKPLSIPLLSDIPVIGPVLFHQDAVVYLSLAAFALVAWTLAKTRLGLLLKAVGESPEAAHAIGYPVLAIRYGAVLFGGAMAGLGGAYLSTVYTPLWVQNMSAGRGWIAVALVVFATWKPTRLLLGAYLFGIKT